MQEEEWHGLSHTVGKRQRWEAAEELELELHHHVTLTVSLTHMNPP